MEHLKITDGDCLIVTVTMEGGAKQEFLTGINKGMKAWCAKRGLNDVTILMYGHTGPHLDIDIKILSVNNVFENEVLR